MARPSSTNGRNEAQRSDVSRPSSRTPRFGMVVSGRAARKARTVSQKDDRIGQDNGGERLPAGNGLESSIRASRRQTKSRSEKSPDGGPGPPGIARPETNSSLHP